MFNDSEATDRPSFGVSKLKSRLPRLVLSLFMSKCHIVGNLMSRLIQGTHRLGKVLEFRGLS